MAPVAEKAQHEPHWPWSFTGVTAPLVVQSIEAGTAERSAGAECTVAAGPFTGLVRPCT